MIVWVPLIFVKEFWGLDFGLNFRKGLKFLFCFYNEPLNQSTATKV